LQPKYRAIYTLENAKLLTSDANKATTGGRFPESWRRLITDFHRSRVDGDWMPAVQKDERLVVVDPPATGKKLRGRASGETAICQRALPASASMRSVSIVG
jgi:hypothetical protein